MIIPLENELVRIELCENASFLRVIHRSSGTVFETRNLATLLYGKSYFHDIPDHAEARVCREADSLVIRFQHFSYWARFKGNQYFKPENGPDLRFVFRIALHDDEVSFTTDSIDGIGEELLDVTFPNGLFRWKTAEPGCLVIPDGYGTAIHFPDSGTVEFNPGTSYLPIYGLLRPDKAGFAVYIKDITTHTAEIRINAEPGEGTANSSFEFERQLDNEPCTLVMKLFAPGADYVALAKWYRSVVKRENRFVSLAEKIGVNPEVEKLVGSVIWKHDVYAQKMLPPGVEKTYSLYVPTPAMAQVEGKIRNWSVYEVFRTARERGFDRVCVYNTGWNRYGFDSGYPTRLPPNPERGTEQEQKEAAEYARSLSDGFIYSVHDNYIDVYPNCPEFSREKLFYTEDGMPVKGGIWRGGRCWLLCTTHGVEYAKRDLPRIAEIFGRGSIYLDVLATQLRRCHHPDHPLSRRGDLENRRELLRLAKKYLGSVASEYWPSDSMADVADLGAFTAIGRRFPSMRRVDFIPLWQLVYHDSVLGYTGEGMCGVCGGDYVAYSALYGLLPTQLDSNGLLFSRRLRNAYCSEMLFHRFPDPNDPSLAETLFSDGTKVAANFGDREKEIDGHRIAPHDFLIYEAEK